MRKMKEQAEQKQINDLLAKEKAQKEQHEHLINSTINQMEHERKQQEDHTNRQVANLEATSKARQEAHEKMISASIENFNEISHQR